MSETKSIPPDGIFEVGRLGETIVVVPTIDLRELNYQRIEEGARKVLHLLDGTEIKNVVMDFGKTDYYGSTALGFFVKLWKRVRDQNGFMAFCNVSAHEKEILEITNLARLWPICSSRSEALKAVQAQKG
jgi:anti-anti-sigma factor